MVHGSALGRRWSRRKLALTSYNVCLSKDNSDLMLDHIPCHEVCASLSLSLCVCVRVCVCVRARAYVHKSFQLSCSFQVSSGIPNCLPPSLSLVSLNFPLFYVSICVCLSVSLFVCLYPLYLLPMCISSVRPQNATKMWNWWQVSNLGGHCNQSLGDFSNCFRLHYWHHKIQSANCPSVSSSIYMHIYLHVQISWHTCVLSHIRLSR